MSFKILIPTDFSEISFHQMEAARALCKAGPTEIELLHIYQPSPEYMNVGEGSEAITLEERRRRMDVQLRNIDALVDNPTVKTQGIIRRGDTVRRCIHEIDHFIPDLVIIGSHGHGALYNMFVGSVARGLLKQSTAPVLVVPGRGDKPSPTWDRMTLGIDFGEQTEKLVRAVDGLAQGLGCQLQVAYMKRPPVPLVDGITAEVLDEGIVRELREEANSKMAKLYNQLELDPERSSNFVEVGDAAGGLLAIARKNKSDVLVVGSHGHGLAYDLILGSTAQQIIKEADRPVLVLPLSQRIAFNLSPKKTPTQSV